MTKWERPRILRSRPTILGPVFAVELLRGSRRRRLYILRAIYALGLLGLVAIAVSTMNTYARLGQTNSLERAALFAGTFYPIFGIFQLIVGSILAAASSSGAIADERQRKTIEFLFATDLSNREVVLGKFAVVMFSCVALLASAAPVIALSQLYGATPIDEVARSTSVAVSTMAFVAAGCILVSTLSTRPREAMVRAFVVAAFLLAGPLLFIFLMIYRPDLYQWIQPVHEFALDANPIVFWVRNTWPQSGMYLPTLPGWEGVANLVWNQSIMAAAFLGWAILRVRAVHLSTSNRPIVASEQTAKRYSLQSLLRPGLDLLPAMLWKELFLQSTIRGMNRKGKWIAALVDGALMSFLIWFWIRCYLSRDELMRPAFAEAMALLSLGVGWVYILVSATRAATSMTLERESGNWESLLSTRLTGPGIVVGKTFGAVLSLRILLLHVIVFFAMGASFFPSEMRWHGLRMCLATLLASFVVSAIGVQQSIRSANSSRAVLSTLWLSSVFAGLYLIPLAWSPWLGRETREFLYTVSFFDSLGWAALADGPRSHNWGYRWTSNSYWVGLGVQFLIGLTFMTYAALRFDRWTGRAPHRARSNARQISS
jgi:ABC-type transport system involved in multi-copper enzyme maturation permease subunit/ABC-type multidrug transport system permease subunit